MKSFPQRCRRYSQLGQLVATVSDVADIRAVDCLLPDNTVVSRLATRMAELMRMPESGVDEHAITYGLVAKVHGLLDPDSTLADADLPQPLNLRLVPEIVAGAADVEPEIDGTTASDEPPPDITLTDERTLLHDSDLALRPDIRIDAQVHQEIAQFASEDRYRECGGLLLGSVTSEDNRRVIHVRAIAPAIGAVGNRATVKFTLRAWESMLRTRDADYSHLRVLGWFHTHAGWGVFMSDPDVFIHQSFFPHPNMVSYVLDPTCGRDAFFVWNDGRISLRPSYGLVGTPREVEVHRKRETTTSSRRPDLRDAIIAGLVIAVAYLGFARQAPVEPLRGSSKPAVTAAASAKMPASTGPASPKKPAKKNPPQIDRVYMIGEGDSPWAIADRVYEDGSLAEALARYNGLSDVSGLQIGQEIRLPQKSVLEKMR